MESKETPSDLVTGSFDLDQDKDDFLTYENNEGSGEGAVSNGSMSLEEKERQEREWRDELKKTEEEVSTLSQVLASKQRRVAELKKNLGIGMVTEFKDGLKHLADSDVVQKTNQALKTAGERTSAAFSNIGKKLGDVKLQIEEKVGDAVTNVKRSKSLFAIQSEAKVSGNKSEATSPSAPVAPSSIGGTADDQVQP